MPRTAEQFQTIHTEGAILPPDVLQRIATGELEGLDAATYHLPPGTKTKEAISQSWTGLLHYWKDFQAARQLILKSDETGTLATREKWLLPLFQELGYGRLTTSKAPEIDGKLFPIERFWQHIPIHLIGCKLQLDHRTKGARGAATAIPHSMVQEFLNRSTEHAWGFLSNGLQLRLLRDSAALSRQSYVEFDLESMMEGEVYADFAILWLVCHQSRLEADKPQDCWLEKWSKLAQEQGTRILEDLRGGVAKAIESLGRGFISHPRNGTLINRLQSGSLTTQDYYRQILRIVYRLLFLFVAEDRGLLHPPTPSDESLRLAHDAARDRYDRFYSLRRLRDLAESYRGSKHADLWHSLSLLFDALGQPEGCPQLALPAFGSFLWSRNAAPDLSGPAALGLSLVDVPVFIRNEDLLEAIRALAFVERNRVLRAVNYRNLGSVELGSVYESLLELHPQINIPGRGFALNIAAGNERKTTGSYYTADPLVQCLLDSALEPVVADAIKGKTGIEAEKAILNLKVCDPAVGSGHFLIAAAHRLARHLARARTGESEPTPQDYQHALRDVIGHCLYGVDLNPMAVELCKISLWMEALEPGKALGFLDHRIQVGNSLLGTTPALLSRGIPDAAFEPVEGDDKAYCREFKKQNKDERKGQGMLFGHQAPWEQLGNLATNLAQLDALPDDSVTDIRSKEQRYAELVKSSTYESGRFLADSWCAAFFWKKTKAFDYPISEKVFRDIERNPHAIAPWMREEITRLAHQYRFLHWHLAFPDVFRPAAFDAKDEDDNQGWEGGFDLMLGNPPWDTMSPDAKEFFSVYDPQIRSVDKAGQERIITNLLEDSGTRDRWEGYCRDLYAIVQFLKDSGRFRLYAPGNLGKGDFNVFRMFVETSLDQCAPNGWAAQIVPEGLYNGANSMAIRQELFDHFTLTRLFGFVNTREVWFKEVHTAAKFCLYCARKSGNTTAFQAAFNIDSEAALADAVGGQSLVIPVTMVREFSPDALAVAELSNQQEIDIATKMYGRCPKFGDESAGPVTRVYMRELDMGNDRELFGESPDGLPLYEGRMVEHYDHRAKGYRSGRGRKSVWEELRFDRPGKSIQPQWRVPNAEIPEKTRERVLQYRAGFCDVASPTNERALVAAIIPPNCICGDKVPTILFGDRETWACLAWIAVANSFAMDFLARTKISLKMSYTVLDSLPFPRLMAKDQIARSLVSRALLLSCTSAEMNSLWDQMAGEEWVQPRTAPDSIPGATDETSRMKLVAEIECIVARDVYGLSRDEVDYILETFPIVKRQNVAKHGDYLTKRVILEIYDQMAQASTARSRVHVPTLRACELVVLILDEWKKPVQRPAADRALSLALNDAARAQVLASAVQQSTPVRRANDLDVRFDTVWKTLLAMNLVIVQNSGHSVIVERVPGSTIQPTDTGNPARAKEAVKAFSAIERQRAAWPDGIDDLEYAFS